MCHKAEKCGNLGGWQYCGIQKLIVRKSDFHLKGGVNHIVSIGSLWDEYDVNTDKILFSYYK